MSMLLDARLLMHPLCRGASVDSTDMFTERLTDWIVTERAFWIGPGGRDLLMASYAEHGWPESSLDLGRSKEASMIFGFIQRALNESYRRNACDPIRIVHPAYTAEGEALAALELDFGTALAEYQEVGCALASCRTHWSTESEQIQLSNGAFFDVYLEPSQRSPEENLEISREFFERHHLFIVGGEMNSHFLTSLLAIGIEGSSITWIELPKSSSAAVVRRRLSGLRGDCDIVMCWTGKIGHDGSELAKKQARSKGAVYIECQTLRSGRIELSRLPFQR